MEQTPYSRRRLNVLTKAERRAAHLLAACGKAGPMTRSPARSASASSGSAKSVTEVLNKRVIDRGVDHARLQLERLMPALRIVGEAIGRGELKAVAPLIKVIDRLDKHQDTVVAKYEYGPEERQGLHGEGQPPGRQSPAPVEPAAPTAERGATKIIWSSLQRKPLIRLDFGTENQGNPSFSNPLLTRVFAPIGALPREPKSSAGGRLDAPAAVRLEHEAQEKSSRRRSRDKRRLLDVAKTIRRASAASVDRRLRLR